MTTKRESHLQRRVRGALAAAFPGCWCVKVHVSEFSAAGTPDLLCCVHGHFVAIEVKQPGEVPTVLQEFTLNNIRHAGGIAVVVSSPEQAVAAVRERLPNRGR